MPSQKSPARKQRETSIDAQPAPSIADEYGKKSGFQAAAFDQERDAIGHATGKHPLYTKYDEHGNSTGIYGADPDALNFVSYGNNPLGGIEYAGRVFIPVDPDDGSADQTSIVQNVIRGCRPGQTAVLPPPTDAVNRYVRCGEVKIPSGVHLDSAGSSPIGWKVKFGPSISQAFNSRIRDIWFKKSKFDISDDGEGGIATSATSSTLSDATKHWDIDQWAGWYVKITSGTGSANISRPIVGNSSSQLILSGVWTTVPDNTSNYELFCNISAITFDGTQLDGTGTDHAGSAAGDAVSIGQFGYDVKFVNNFQAWNYGGGGIAVYGNTDHVANTGTPYLATGVFVCVDNSKIFNCGAGIVGIGAPRDGSSFHLSNVLIDHCPKSLLFDTTVNGVPGTAPVNSGGITVLGANVRVELGGSDTANQIYNNGANVSIFGLWQSSGITTAGHKVNYHRSGTFKAIGGRCTTANAGVWSFFCDPGYTGIFDVETNHPNTRVGAREMLTASEDQGSEIETFRLRVTRGATGVTVQSLSGSGFGWGVGSTAGDRVSNAVSTELTAGGASVNVGSNYTQIYYQMSPGGGILQVTQAYKQFSKVLFASIQKQTAGIAGLTADCQLLNGAANFSVIFTDTSGAEKNIIASMAVGQYIDVSVGLAVLR